MGRRLVIGSLVVGLFASPGAAQVRTRVAELTFIAGLPGEVICEVSATATAPDRAVLGVAAYDDLAWSPDGRRLAVVWHDGSQRILDVMRPDGTKRRRISRQALSVDIGMDPTWSPDGRRLAFVTNGSLFVARADARGRKRIVDVRRRMATIQTPTWSTRGNRIFFYWVEFGPFSVRPMSIRPDGSAARDEEPKTVDERLGAWSPDGKRRARLMPEGIEIVNANGSNPHLLVPRDDTPALPPLRWSPDGTMLAFVRADPSTHSSRTHVWLVDTRTGAQHRATDAVSSESAPAWRPGEHDGFGPCVPPI